VRDCRPGVEDDPTGGARCQGEEKEKRVPVRERLDGPQAAFASGSKGFPEAFLFIYFYLVFFFSISVFLFQIIFKLHFDSKMIQTKL
jgi:hypothetical protein